jgi:hypothetical protein
LRHVTQRLPRAAVLAEGAGVVMAEVDVPVGIDRTRHHELSGRAWHVWWRRAVLLVITAVPVLALLDVFGQHASPVAYQSPAATLQVDSPVHLRGGLSFTTDIVVTPHRALKDMRLHLDNGWFQAMSFNGAVPQPSGQSAAGSWQIWDFGAVPAGVPFHLWISWQVNATNLGRHSQAVQLYDGGSRLMTVQRTVTVFP